MGILDVSDVAVRVALLRAWDKRCVRCKEPITLLQLHIDHFIPKSLDAVQLAEAINMFELAEDFNVHETYNLVTSCGPCNISKSDKLPLLNQLTFETLETAKTHAPEVEKQATKIKTMLSANVTKALATIIAHRDNPDVIQEFSDLIGGILEPQDDAAELTMEFMLTEFVKLGIDSHGATRVFSLGDCPNTNCIAGDVEWQKWEYEGGEFRAGECGFCQTRAVVCPECEAMTMFFWNEVDCDGCDRRFGVVERDGGIDAFVAL